MKKRFLVPLDGSALADRVVQHVLRPLLRPDDEVVLLTVVEPAADAERGGRLARVAAGHLEGFHDTLLSIGVTSKMQVVFGDPVDEIVRFTREERIDLVCLATHGRSGFWRFVRGSVAEAVLRRAPVPVLAANPWALVANHGTWAYRRILVPLDGSERATHIVAHVEVLAHRLASEVVLLQVETVVPGGIAAPMTPIPPPLVRPRNTSEVEASLEVELRWLEAAGIPTKVVAEFGDVVDAILAVAERERIDLVAMSTHGYAGVARFLFGSKTEDVLRQGRWPILALSGSEDGFQSGSEQEEIGVTATTERTGEGLPALNKKARDLMTPNPGFVQGGASVREAAKMMRELDVGALPVCDDTGQFVGMITDRDITLRVTAEGKSPDLTTVQDGMTRVIVSCGEDTDVTEVAQLMQKHRIRRVPVVRTDEADTSHPTQIVGIVSLGDLAIDLLASDVPGKTLAKVSEDPDGLDLHGTQFSTSKRPRFRP